MLNLKYVCHVIKVISNDTDQSLLLNSDKSIYQVFVKREKERYAKAKHDFIWSINKQTDWISAHMLCDQLNLRAVVYQWIIWIIYDLSWLYFYDTSAVRDMPFLNYACGLI